jgi:hypothetical protein
MKKILIRYVGRVLDYTPKLYWGPRWLNFLGLQLIRIAWHNLGRRKPWKVQPRLRPIVAELEMNGTVVIENFFSEDIFRQIRCEFDSAYQEWSVNKLHALKSSGWNEEYYQDIEEFVAPYVSATAKSYLAGNEDFRLIVEAITHRKIRIAPEPVFWSISVKETGVTGENIKYHDTQHLHLDVIFPSVKVWIYLNDVHEKNGAFAFAKGSHSPNRRWLLHEYRMSLKPQDHGCITSEEAEKLGFFETPLSAQANTVIISNHMGYHRRGEFEVGARRDAVHIDFRYTESLRNRYSKLIDGLLSARRRWKRPTKVI